MPKKGSLAIRYKAATFRTCTYCTAAVLRRGRKANSKKKIFWEHKNIFWHILTKSQKKAKAIWSMHAKNVYLESTLDAHNIPVPYCIYRGANYWFFNLHIYPRSSSTEARKFSNHTLEVWKTKHSLYMRRKVSIILHRSSPELHIGSCNTRTSSENVLSWLEICHDWK